MSEITAKFFKEKVGQDPIQDDLDRCNCDKAGQVGHYQCGWCNTHQKPLFMCNEACQILADIFRTPG